ncbi:hypothetical protein EIN_252290, partial [Entamoeba invadens IP1]
MSLSPHISPRIQCDTPRSNYLTGESKHLSSVIHRQQKGKRHCSESGVDGLDFFWSGLCETTNPIDFLGIRQLLERQKKGIFDSFGDQENILRAKDFRTVVWCLDPARRKLFKKLCDQAVDYEECFEDAVQTISIISFGVQSDKKYPDFVKSVIE